MSFETLCKAVLLFIFVLFCMCFAVSVKAEINVQGHQVEVEHEYKKEVNRYIQDIKKDFQEMEMLAEAQKLQKIGDEIKVSLKGTWEQVDTSIRNMLLQLWEIEDVFQKKYKEQYPHSAIITLNGGKQVYEYETTTTYLKLILISNILQIYWDRATEQKERT